jgi:hypothetical protein
LRYKFAYIDEIKADADETLPAFMDARVHEALERLYRQLQVQIQPSLDEILAFYREQWGEMAKDIKIFKSSSAKLKDYCDLGELYVRDYYLKHQPFQEGKILDLEVTRFYSIG